jgi:hypothetical protein
MRSSDNGIVGDCSSVSLKFMLFVIDIAAARLGENMAGLARQCRCDGIYILQRMEF